jgi:hypothetical protein
MRNMNNIEVPAIVKPKSVIIDGGLHSKFKMLCKGKSLKIGGVIEDLIFLYLTDPKKTQDLIEETKTKTPYRYL